MLKNLKKYDTIIIGFGAHTIKNRCYDSLARIFLNYNVKAIVTNGASVIHDTEIAFYNDTSEDVRDTIQKGEFGLGRPSCFMLNDHISRGNIESGLGDAISNLTIHGNYKNKSVFNLANRHDVKPCVSIGMGHDIFQMYDNFDPSMWGKLSHNDFLSLTQIIQNTNRGLFICVGSKVFVPMVIEKAYSLAKRKTSIEIGRGLMNPKEINFDSMVVDLFPLELPEMEYGEHKGDPSHSGYYERQLKTFSRISSNIEYIQEDNRFFYSRLASRLAESL